MFFRASSKVVSRRTLSRLAPLFLLAVALTSFPAPARATDYYVNDASTTNDNWCTDIGRASNDGLTPATPKATVQAILDAYDLEPGDIVHIDTGTYGDPAEVTAADGGSDEAAVTFEASPYGVTWFDSWRINGARNVVLMTGTSDKYPNVALRYMTVNGEDETIRISNAVNCAVKRCAVTGSMGYTLRAEHADISVSSSDGTVIENCFMANTFAFPSFGVRLEGCHSSRIINCTIKGHTVAGVAMVGGADNTVRNTIIYTDIAGSVCMLVDGGTSLASSDYNDLFAAGDSHVGRIDRAPCATMADWQAATGQDQHSLSLDPLRTNIRLHLKSVVGHYDEASGTWVTDAELSPCIDAGDPASDFSKEPAPHGGRINMGAYGNTEMASKSGGRGITVVAPDGGEVWFGTRNITWETYGPDWQPDDTVRIEYSRGIGWTLIAGAGAVPYEAGTFAWDTSTAVPNTGTFLIRITANAGSDPKATDQSDGIFELVGRGPREFYVNDTSTTHDNWCTAIGNNANDGLAPATPKATVQAILATYGLVPGDTFRIDTGTYNLTSDITVSFANRASSGAPVTFEASPYGVTLDRGSQGSSGTVWSVDADGVIITTVSSNRYPNAQQSYMKITNAGTGVDAGGKDFRLSRCDVSGNGCGIHLGRCDGAVIENCIVRGTGGGSSQAGIYLEQTTNATVRQCTIWRWAPCGLRLVETSYSTLANNIIEASGAGNYAVRCFDDSVYPLEYGSLPIPNPTDPQSVYGQRYRLSVMDYNAIIVANGAFVGNANGADDFQTLASWQATMHQDAHSQAAEPLFANAAGGDFHLKSKAGRYNPANGSWVMDFVSSPCIDAGDPASPWTAEPAPRGRRANQGAYGNTEFASKSPSAVPVPVPTAPLGVIVGGPNPPAFQWTAVPGVTYTVEVLGLGQFEVADATWTPARTLWLNSPIWWRVRAKDGTVAGPWSPWVSFTLKTPVTDFSAAPRVGDKPLPVAFTDKSTGTITARAWTFGDGGTSTEQNPTYTYTEYGKYTVTLTVTRPAPDGQATVTKTAYIDVKPVAPAAAPAPIAPRGDVAGGANPPPFTWTGVAGAATYTVEILGRGAATVADTTWTPAAALPMNQTIYWRVRAANAGGAGPWSAWATFRLLPPARTLTIVIDPPGSGTVMASPAKAGYQDGEWVMLTARAAAGFKFQQWSQAAAGTWTTAWIRIQGDMTVQATFGRVIGAAVPTSPLGNVPTAPNPPAFTWQAAANATSYEVEIFGKGAQPAADTTWTPAAPLALRAMTWWRVRGKDGATVGPWSAWVWFNMSQAPAAPQPLAAQAGGEGGPRLVGATPAPGAAAAGVRAIRLTFDRPVAANATLLELTGQAVGRRMDFTVRYEAGGAAVVLEFAQPLAADDYTLILRSAGVWATQGGVRIDLDGEVADADDPSSLPSGDGAAGGDAEIRFRAD